MRKIMKINDSSLKEILIKAKNQSDVVTDLKAHTKIKQSGPPRTQEEEIEKPI